MTILTRKSYLLIAFLFLIAAIILFMVSELIPRLNHDIVLLLAALSGIAVLAFIFYLLLAAMQISPTYRCRACGYQFWKEDSHYR